MADPRQLSVDECIQAIQESSSKMAHALAAGRAALEQYARAAQETFEACVHSIVEEYGRDIASIRAAIADWDDPCWASYVPATDAPLPSEVRVGRLLPPNGAEQLKLPALVPLVGSAHLVVEGTSRTTLLSLLQSIAMRALLASPPGAIRLALIDPVSAGQAVAPFLQLPTSLRGQLVAVRPEEVDRQLAELEEEIVELTTTRLSTSYSTIEEYNASNPSIPIPYRFVLYPDFPAGLERRAAERLLSLTRNGPRTGLYFLISHDDTRKLPRDIDISPMFPAATVLSIDADRQGSVKGGTASYPFEADQLPATQQSAALLQALSDAVGRISNSLSLKQIAPESRWTGNSQDGIAATIGIQADGRPYQIEIGNPVGTTHHGLIGGTVGSGKSNLLHVIIGQLAQTYGPDELELYLLDFREGVEFQPYLELPHARVVALESEREFALSVLDHLRSEMVRRADLFRLAPGGAVGAIWEYRRQTGKVLPRILLIIDEFQVLFNEDDRLAQDAARILEDLVKRARGFGIHVLLSSQSPTVAGVYGNRIYDQMGLRIALRCSEADSQALVGTDAANKLDRPGLAIVRTAASTTQIQVASLPLIERRALIVAQNVEADSRPAPISFQSQAPADLLDHPAIKRLLESDVWPGHSPSVDLPLGEPIAMAGTGTLRLERAAGSNLLIAGGSEPDGYGLLSAALSGIALQRAPGDAHIALIDLARQDSQASTVLRHLADGLPHHVAIASERDASPLLSRLMADLEERRSTSSRSSVFVIIAGLQRWRALRTGDSYRPSDERQALTTLADEGPEHGMHLMLWVDSLADLERGLGSRNAASYFDRRVALRLGESESTTLVGGPVAARMADNRAILRDEENAVGVIEKIKPFPIVNEDVLNQLLSTLQRRGGQR